MCRRRYDLLYASLADAAELEEPTEVDPSKLFIAGELSEVLLRRLSRHLFKGMTSEGTHLMLRCVQVRRQRRCRGAVDAHPLFVIPFATRRRCNS